MINPSQRHRHAVISLSTKADQPTLHDEQFGDIPYRRLANTLHVRIRMGTDGRLQATLPTFAPLGTLKKLIDAKRPQLTALVQPRLDSAYHDGQAIGHSHVLRLVASPGTVLKGGISHQSITVVHPTTVSADHADVQVVIKEQIAKALRIESKAYLPRRLRYLADHGGFGYERVRFAHQSGRWGSCSSSGTISLNIALMNLPFEMIDYVLVHELAHTRQMNHSPAFWEIVAMHCPDYKNIRRALKSRNPYL